MVNSVVIVVVMLVQVKADVGDGTRQIDGMLPAKIVSKIKKKKERTASDRRERKLPFLLTTNKS